MDMNATLTLVLVFEDDEIRLEKKAPELPAGFTWQQDMIVRTGDYIHEVDSIEVLPDGMVVGLATEEYEGKLDEELVDQFKELGWSEG